MTNFAGHQWLTPGILATQKAQIRRTEVQSQPGQRVRETLSRKKAITKKGWYSLHLKVQALSSNPSTKINKFKKTNFGDHTAGQYIISLPLSWR
jgi:hypothetical protein